jgi:hypothetical protein
MKNAVDRSAAAKELKWGFADLEDMSIHADRETLSPEDMARVMDLLKIRLIQSYLFVKAMVGAKDMKNMLRPSLSLVGRVERSVRIQPVYGFGAARRDSCYIIHRAE